LIKKNTKIKTKLKKNFYIKGAAYIKLYVYSCKIMEEGFKDLYRIKTKGGIRVIMEYLKKLFII